MAAKKKTARKASSKPATRPPVTDVAPTTSADDLGKPREPQRGPTIG